MNKKEKLQATVGFLINSGWDADSAKEIAKEAIAEGEPILETFCFHKLAEFLLATVHDSSWIKNRAKAAEPELGGDIIKRLLDSGASAKDLAQFARLMQREYLSSLGCLLDGAGIWGTPDLPYKDFRIFAVRELDSPDNCKPEAQIKELHESLGFSDWETETKLSREAAETKEQKFKAGRKRRGRSK